MKFISSILPTTLNTEPDSFDWGVAEYSNILHNGILYEKIEVDFNEGEVRFYQFHDPERTLQQQAPTVRRPLILYMRPPAAGKIIEDTDSSYETSDDVVETSDEE